MQNKTLYRFIRQDGGITVSTNKPDCEYTVMYRLIADKGMAMTRDGVSRAPCVDVDSVDGWYEVKAIEKEEADGEVMT